MEKTAENFLFSATKRIVFSTYIYVNKMFFYERGKVKQ